MRPGPRNLITDVPGLLVGNAGDARLKSGVTVVTAQRPFSAAVDIRGGAPGTRETDLLAPGRLAGGAVDALVLAGGSAFGLDAAAGVVDRLRARGRGYRAGRIRVPLVPAAILFDLANGGEKDWATSPYPALGARALEAAGPDFLLGSVGAGLGALTATLKGGLGSASVVTQDGVHVGAVAAVNAFGAATVPGRRHFWAGALEMGGEFGGLGPAQSAFAAFEPRPMKPGHPDAGTSTTIAVVATDAALDSAELRRMAEAAHAGLARALYPAHTLFDGDLVFAVSTGEAPTPAGPLGRMVLEHAAALCLARSVARGVFEAQPAEGDILPAWCQLSD